MMEFIKQLDESRMYRRLGQLTGMRIEDIAKTMFNHFLLLRGLYDVDKAKAMTYASAIVSNLNFNGFRPSMPDLYNMIVMVMEQKKYADRVFNDWDIVLPEMRIKRVFRDMAAGTLNSNDFAQLMLILQRRISGLDADQLKMRRMVQQPKLTATDQNWMKKRLIQMTRNSSGASSDLHELYRQAI